jgi:hypothetical protein
VDPGAAAVAHRIVPDARERQRRHAHQQRRARLAARLHLALAGGGALVFPFGLAAELSGKGAALLIPASLAWFAGALLFLALVLRRALKGSSQGA